MEKTIDHQWHINLKLNVKEAIWLKGMVQNYLGQGEEDPEQQKMRMRFWEAIPKFEELYKFLPKESDKEEIVYDYKKS